MADNIFQKIYRGAQELFSKDNDNFQGHTVVPKKDLSNLSRILTEQKMKVNFNLNGHK